MGGQKIYPCNCKICGKDFYIDLSTLNKLNSGKYKNTYCSKECSIIAKQRGSSVTCINCGKVFYRKKNLISHSICNCTFCMVEQASKNKKVRIKT